MEHFLLLHSYNGPRSDLLNRVNATLFPCRFSSLSNEVLVKFILYGDERSNSFMLLNALKCSIAANSHALAPTSCQFAVYL